MAVELHVIVETAPYVGVDHPNELEFESPDVIAAGASLLRALTEVAPPGCGVTADHASEAATSIPGVRDHDLGRARADIGHQWQWGLNSGYPRGLVHSTSLLAPLTKHDRYDDQHQVVVTLWDLRAWLAPAALPAEWVTWQRAMLKRAVKHADAFVVPSHALASELESIVPVRDRIRVVPVGVDAAFVPRSWRAEVDTRAVVVFDAVDDTVRAVRAALENHLDVEVVDAVGASEFMSTLASEGIDLGRVTVSEHVPAHERAEVLSRAAVVINTSPSPVWPWRLAEALAVGVPIVTLPSAVVEDVVADAALVTSLDRFESAIGEAIGPQARRLGVLAADRAGSFGWRAAAEQIWALHADL